MTEKMMTEETPGKVFGLLGAALASMFVLFVVSSTNASFAGTEAGMALADPFNPDKVMAELDGAAAGYSQFLTQNLFQPVQADLAFYTDTGRWIIQNADMAILNSLGLESFAQIDSGQPRVAGAYINVARPAPPRPVTLLEFLGF